MGWCDGCSTDSAASRPACRGPAFARCLWRIWLGWAGGAPPHHPGGRARDKRPGAGPGGAQPPEGPSAKLAAIRAARHPGYERVVFQFEGAKVPGYRIEYVREITLGESDDQYLTLEGGALVEATFQGTASDDHRPGTQTVPDKFTPALAQVKQIGLAEDWEGVVRLGIGLEHRAGFRVLEPRDPARVVVDLTP